MRKRWLKIKKQAAGIAHLKRNQHEDQLSTMQGEMFAELTDIEKKINFNKKRGKYYTHIEKKGNHC